mmetsp:Transcript_150996/g.485256  ORF Transcript_150996/g.485256 Transcript_150996/m.485256 type:complete len:271 (-) Transcript_150996:3165-3977(-)
MLDHNRRDRFAILVESAGAGRGFPGSLSLSEEGSSGAHEAGYIAPGVEQKQVHHVLAGPVGHLVGPQEPDSGDEVAGHWGSQRLRSFTGLPSSLQQLGHGRLREKGLRLDHRLHGLPRHEGEALGALGERHAGISRPKGLLYSGRGIQRHSVGWFHTGQPADDQPFHDRASAMHLRTGAWDDLPLRATPELRGGQRGGRGEAGQAPDEGAAGQDVGQAQGGREPQGVRRPPLLRPCREPRLHTLCHRGGGPSACARQSGPLAGALQRARG